MTGIIYIQTIRCLIAKKLADRFFMFYSSVRFFWVLLTSDSAQYGVASIRLFSISAIKKNPLQDRLLEMRFTANDFCAQ